MIKLLKYITLIIIFISSCNYPQKEDGDYEKLIASISESVMGLQFKALESKGASEIYEEYKITKIEVIRNELLKRNNDLEVMRLEKIRNEFNNLTMDSIMLGDIKNGYRENPYIKEFENLFIEQFIKMAESNMIMDISDLKIIYDN